MERPEGQKKLTRNQTVRSVKRLLPYYRPYLKTMILDLFCAAMTTVCELVLPMIIRRITNAATGGSDEALTAKLILTMGGMYIFMRFVDAAASYYMNSIGHIMGTRIETDLRADLFSHLQKLSVSYYNDAKVGVLMSRITNDMFDVTEFAHHCPEEFFIAGIKIVGGYDANKALGLPYIMANVLLTDPKCGALKALVSGNFINDARTGAQPAIMMKLLAAKTDVVTIIGTGLMAYYSLTCIAKINTLREVRLCDISEAAQDSFIARFPDAPFRFVKCKSNEEGCVGADVIITITNANANLVEEPWVKKGALVMTMGSFRETSFDVVRKADLIAVDQVGQSLHRGNVKELAELGEITAESFNVLIPDVLAGKQKFVRNPEDRIYAQIIGTGMLDVACAGYAYKKLVESGRDILSVDMTK